MRRRQFLGGLIGAAGVIPVRAEQNMPAVGLLAAPPLSAYRGFLDALTRIDLPDASKDISVLPKIIVLPFYVNQCV
jgi:hypothetical protein